MELSELEVGILGSKFFFLISDGEDNVGKCFITIFKHNF